MARLKAAGRMPVPWPAPRSSAASHALSPTLIATLPADRSTVTAVRAAFGSLLILAGALAAHWTFVP
jgi:hypothetical protein